MIRDLVTPSSYIVEGDAVFWCVEWDPGLIVLRIAADGRVAGAAVRSPIPELGGRMPLPSDLDAGWQENEDHLMHQIIFSPWDAQFDADDRARAGRTPADASLPSASERPANSAMR